jgi:predicted DNA-binding transcriptional regulator YafY
MGREATVASVKQMARVVALGQALASRPRGIIVKRYADESGISIRNVYRDLITLQDAGFPVEHDATRYWLPRGWLMLNNAGFEPDEVLALFLARQLAGAARTTGFGKALERLWAKVSTKDAQRELLPRDDGTFGVRGPAAIDYAPHRRTIEVIERAIPARQVVWCRYRGSHTGEITERCIEPGEVYLDAGLEAIYCIAWCQLRDAVRVFAVHRFLAVRPTDETFRYRPETRSRVALRNAFRIWRSDNIERVRLRFSTHVAAEILERRWHPSQSVEEPDDGAVILSMDVAEPMELVRWLLGFGADVHVLAPKWLAADVRKRHEAATARTATAYRPKASSRKGNVISRTQLVTSA